MFKESPAASPKKKAGSKLILGCYGGVGIVGKGGIYNMVFSLQNLYATTK